MTAFSTVTFLSIVFVYSSGISAVLFRQSHDLPSILIIFHPCLPLRLPPSSALQSLDGYVSGVVPRFADVQAIDQSNRENYRSLSPGLRGWNSSPKAELQEFTHTVQSAQKVIPSNGRSHRAWPISCIARTSESDPSRCTCKPRLTTRFYDRS